MLYKLALRITIQKISQKHKTSNSGHVSSAIYAIKKFQTIFAIPETNFKHFCTSATQSIKNLPYIYTVCLKLLCKLFFFKLSLTGIFGFR